MTQIGCTLQLLLLNVSWSKCAFMDLPMKRSLCHKHSVALLPWLRGRVMSLPPVLKLRWWSLKFDWDAPSLSPLLLLDCPWSFHLRVSELPLMVGFPNNWTSVMSNRVE